MLVAGLQVVLMSAGQVSPPPFPKLNPGQLILLKNCSHGTVGTWEMCYKNVFNNFSSGWLEELEDFGKTFITNVVKWPSGCFKQSHIQYTVYFKRNRCLVLKCEWSINCLRSINCLNNYWRDCHEIWHRHSYFPEAELSKKKKKKKIFIFIYCHDQVKYAYK